MPLTNITAAIRYPRGFDPANLWLLIGVDFHFLDNDPLGLINFELRESGCVPALLAAYKAMLSSPDLKLLEPSSEPALVAAVIVERTKRYHTLVTQGVEKLNGANIVGQFRSEAVYFPVFTEGTEKSPLPTATDLGLKNFAERKFVRGPRRQPEIALYYKYDSLKSRVLAQEIDPHKLAEIFSLLCERLVEDLRDCSSEKRLEYIAEFIQDSMLLHPFGDANNRTLVATLLLDILYSVQESPVIFEQANIFDGFDVAGLVLKIKQAQQLYQDVITAKRVPRQASFEAMSDTILIHIAAAAGEIELVQKIIAANPAAVFKCSPKGSLPIQVAAEYEQTKIVKMLLREMKLPGELSTTLRVIFAFPQHNVNEYINALVDEFKSIDPNLRPAIFDLSRHFVYKQPMNLYIAMALALHGNDKNIFAREFKTTFLYYDFNIGYIWQAFNQGAARDILISAIKANYTNSKIRFFGVKDLFSYSTEDLRAFLFKHELLDDTWFNNIEAICKDMHALSSLQKIELLSKAGFLLLNAIHDIFDLNIILNARSVRHYKQQIIDLIIKDPKFLLNLCQDVFDLSAIVEAMPEQLPQLYKIFRRDPKFLLNLCRDDDDLQQLLTAFPKHKQKLSKLVRAKLQRQAEPSQSQATENQIVPREETNTSKFIGFLYAKLPSLPFSPRRFYPPNLDLKA